MSGRASMEGAEKTFFIWTARNGSETMSTIQTQTEERPLERRPRWTTTEEPERQRTLVSWGAIFAGAAVALVVSVVLNLLGFGIGAAAVDPAEVGRGIGIGAGIWTLVVSLAALFVGGWIAGRLSGSFRKFEGALHGLVTWSLVTLAVLWLVTTAVGTVVGGAFGAVVEAAPAAAEQVQQQDASQAQQQIEQQAGQVDPQQVEQIAGEAATITGASAIVLAIAMIFGGAAAAGGGIVGSARRRKEIASSDESLH
jgi:hypothetical protein